MSVKRLMYFSGDATRSIDLPRSDAHALPQGRGVDEGAQRGRQRTSIQHGHEQPGFSLQNNLGHGIVSRADRRQPGRRRFLEDESEASLRVGITKMSAPAQHSRHAAECAWTPRVTVTPGGSGSSMIQSVTI